MKRQLKKDAKQLAEIFLKTFPNLKDEKDEKVIQKTLIASFNKEKIKKWTDRELKILYTCCKTPNGYCYMVGFNDGYKKKMMNIRSIEFTNHVDNALNKLGYQQQSLKQKKEMVNILGFKDAFDKYLTYVSK